MICQWDMEHTSAEKTYSCKVGMTGDSFWIESPRTGSVISIGFGNWPLLPKGFVSKIQYACGRSRGTVHLHTYASFTTEELAALRELDRRLNQEARERVSADGPLKIRHYQ